MKGWETKNLGDVYDVRDGTHDSPKYCENGYPLITSKNLKSNGLIFDNVKYISESDYKKINERSAVHKGDVLFAMIGTIGNPIVVEVEPDFAIKNVALFKISQNQDSYFLKYYLQTDYVQSKMQKEAKGSTQKFVGLGYLRNFPIAVPPLSEQKRIVAILDEAFEGIDRAIANTEKNLANARELFESYLNAIFTQKGDRWEEVRSKLIPLSTLLSKQPRNGWSPPAIFQTGSGVPVLTLSAVTGFHYNGSRIKLTTAPTSEEAYYWLQEGELLITRSNTPELVGHVAIYDGNPAKVICPDLIMKMTVDHTKADTRFIYYFLRSATARKYLTGKAKGASSTMPKITKQVVQETPIPTFNLTEQQAIVKKLDELAAETQRLETIYRQKITALKELKQSILQKAFTGELTADTANHTRKVAQEVNAA
jgi:type I restriction enzyme S subunit